MRHSGIGNLPGSPEEWIASAESDLKLARLALSDPSIKLEAICFHAQQAAEKAFKGALIMHGIDFPLTHDMEELLVIAEQGGLPLPDGIREVDLLTPYAVETRYPGFWTAVTKAEAEEALVIAERAFSWVLGLVAGDRD